MCIRDRTWAELEYELGMVEPDLIFNDGIDYGYRAQLEADVYKRQSIGGAEEDEFSVYLTDSV